MAGASSPSVALECAIDLGCVEDSGLPVMRLALASGTHTRSHTNANMRVEMSQPPSNPDL